MCQLVLWSLDKRPEPKDYSFPPQKALSERLFWAEPEGALGPSLVLPFKSLEILFENFFELKGGTRESPFTNGDF